MCLNEMIKSTRSDQVDKHVYVLNAKQKRKKKQQLWYSTRLDSAN